MDEPTTGLDPETRQVVWKMLNELKVEKCMTIFLTTHYMEEAAKADYTVIINKGRIVAEGTPAELKKTYSKDYVKIVPINKEKLVESLKLMNKLFDKTGGNYVIQVETAQEAIKIIEDLKDNIKQFEVLSGTMDDVFINIIGGGTNV
jgi:multidrug/hemolysin transport system ATP-binding protein